MTAEVEDLKAMWLELRAHVEQLAGVRQQYVEFFEQSTEAYVVTDLEGTIIDLNPAAVDVLQRRRRQAQGSAITTMVALERRTEFRSRLKRVVAREPGAPRQWSTVLEAPGLRTGATVTVRPIEGASSPELPLAAAQAARRLMIERLEGNSLDRDAKREMQAALEELDRMWEELRRYAEFFEYAPDACFITDAGRGARLEKSSVPGLCWRVRPDDEPA
jgi:PAS domain S-box-containing protein